MLLRPPSGDASTLVLPVVASAMVGTVTYFAVALARLFWVAPDDGFGQYKILAAGLLAVLVVPAATVGTSAARLSVRRREDRLAVLRLLGASSGWVRGVTMIEASLLALVGAITGLLGYAALAPALTFIPVAGRSAPLAEIWLPVWGLCLLLVALTGVSTFSAAAGLRRVIVSPLGVRMRVNAPRLHRVRLLVGVAILVGGIILLQLPSASWGAVGITVAIVVVLVAVMAALNIVGPFLTGVVARRRLARVRNAEGLIAARSVLESPVIRVGTAIPDDPTLSTTIYRITQEALTNALRYAAGATRVDVRIESDGTAVSLTVTDDGHATAADAPPQGSGRGLQGIAERAAAFAGAASSGPLPAGGWRTTATLRLDDESETDPS
ncbi:hypothetical protein KZC51_12455 [Microbacterium sp. SSW1-49]|uniref:histidine kinase n=1 Tax=Microbacterium croceum TaxID=2851645 RepID=A0ABT0FGY8_9MICO|nr:ATP-binding protein [Microbacterium croceum]MCK2036944.1 hypothetical protein [Microbacterium croceum]